MTGTKTARTLSKSIFLGDWNGSIPTIASCRFKSPGVRLQLGHLGLSHPLKDGIRGIIVLNKSDVRLTQEEKRCWSDKHQRPATDTYGASSFF